MVNLTRFAACLFAFAVALAAFPGADAPHIYAIKGARVVTAAGPPISSGTIVIRNGLIDAVGSDVQVPSDAVVIEGAGLTVYPGLIDMGTSVGVDAPAAGPAPEFRSTEESERYKRTRIFRPDLLAADQLRADSAQRHSHYRDLQSLRSSSNRLPRCDFVLPAALRQFRLIQDAWQSDPRS